MEILAFNRTPVLYNYPILPRLLLDDVPEEQVAIALAPLLEGRVSRLVTERVEAVDASGSRLSTETGEFAFDYLILALGGRAVPLAQTEGLCVYYPKAARHLIRLRAELETLLADPSPTGAVLRFAVVGGGLTGVEFAASLHEAIDRICARHHRSPDAAQVTIYEQAPRLLPGSGLRLANRIGTELQRRGIAVETGCEVQRVEAGHLVTTSGDRPADRVLCCIGSKADLRPRLDGIALDDGIAVTASLQSRSAPRVFAIGDAIRLAAPPRFELKRAVYAMAQGRHAARNVLRMLADAPLRPYPLRAKPTTVSLGPSLAVLEHHGLCLAGRWVGRLKRRLETRYFDDQSG